MTSVLRESFLNYSTGSPRAVSLALWLVTFIFIFGWKVTYFADLIFIVSLALSGLLLFRMSDALKMEVILILGALVILAMYAFAIILINNTGEWILVLRTVRAGVNFAGALSLVFLYLDRYGENFALIICRDIFTALVVHGLIMAGMQWSVSFRRVVFSLVHTLDYVNKTAGIEEGIRIPGLTYGLSVTSVVQSFGLFIVPYLWSERTFGRFRNTIIPVGTLILIFSILISAKSAFVVFFPLVVIMGGAYFLAQDHFPVKKLAGLILGVSVTFGALLALTVLLKGGVINAPDWLPDNTRSSLWVFWDVSQIFLNPTTQYQMAQWLKMFFLPDGVWHTIFGNGNFGRGDAGYIQSDIGYVRTIFALGIVGQLLMLMPMVVGVFAAWRIRKCAPWIAALTITFIAAGVGMNFKEVALLTRNQWSIQAMFICICLIHEWQKNETRS